MDDIWKIQLATLKRVFQYGNATGTHLAILDLLREMKIPAAEYKKWNQKK